MSKPRPNPSAGRPAAIGLRAHSGWAVLVAVAGSLRSPAVLDRRRIVLADAAVAGSKQPYHAAAARASLDDAAELVARCRESSGLLADQALGSAIDELTASGYTVSAAGLLLASGRSLPDLASILASHALIHTAEGELFRNVLARTSQRHGLSVVKVKERQLVEQSASALGISAEELPGSLSALGKKLGPPWRQDEKYAALAGWLALSF